jgi:hypothetical protein
MLGRLLAFPNWSIYVLLEAVVIFFVYVIIKSNLPEKKDKKGQDK